MPLPLAEWMSALDRMTSGIDRLLEEQDRHLAEWSPFLEETAALGVLLGRLGTPGEDRSAGGNSCLAAVDELAATLEEEFRQREAVVRTWIEAFARWRESLEQARAAVGRLELPTAVDRPATG